MKQLAIFLVLLFATSSNGQIRIEKKNRVSNFYPGYCLWASVEMLGNHHSIKSLKNLAKIVSKETDSSASVANIHAKLKSLEVKYKLQDHGNFGLEVLQKAMEEKLGCILVVKTGSFGRFPHAIVLVHFTKDKVQFVDPNDHESTYEAGRDWFDYWWTGFVLVLEK